MKAKKLMLMSAALGLASVAAQAQSTDQLQQALAQAREAAAQAQAAAKQAQAALEQALSSRGAGKSKQRHGSCGIQIRQHQWFDDCQWFEQRNPLWLDQCDSGQQEQRQQSRRLNHVPAGGLVQWQPLGSDRFARNRRG